MMTGGRDAEDGAAAPSTGEPAADKGSSLGLIAAASPLIAGAFALAIYVATGAPGAWWGDGLELATAAKVLGIPHPTGYPLYVWLGHAVLTVFHDTDPGLEMTLTSAVLCALGAALLGLAAYGFLRERAEGGASAALERGGAAMVALGVTLVIAFSRTLWDHATFAEVYPLTFFLVSAMTVVATRPVGPGGGPAWPRVLLLGAIAGLSTLNHYSAAAAGPLVLFTVLAWGRREGRSAAYLLLLIVPVLVSLGGYLWIPWRAAQNPPLNFGDPDSLAGLLWVTGGGQYGRMQALHGGLSAARLSAGARGWLAWWGEQVAGPGSEGLALGLGVVIVAGGVAGNVLLMRRRWARGAGGLMLIGTTLVFGAVYRIPDIDGYFLPALAGVVMGGLELVRLMSAAAGSVPGRMAVATTTGLGLMLLGLTMIRVHLPSVDKSWDRGPEQWAGSVLDALPEGALVITRQGADSEIYALWFEQMARGKRPDVSVYGSGFIFSGWYGSYFEAEGRPRIPVFATDRPPGTKAEFDVALVGGVIVPNLRERRVFVTYQDPVLEEYFAPRPVARLLPAEYYERTAYRLNPPGPVLYELTRNLQLEPVALARFEEMFGDAERAER